MIGTDCGWQSADDDTPCSKAIGHQDAHRVRSPYGDPRWIDFDVKTEREVARGGGWGGSDNARQLDEDAGMDTLMGFYKHSDQRCCGYHHRLGTWVIPGTSLECLRAHPEPGAELSR